MESGQAELSVLWKAYVERFSGRRVAAALSFLLVPLVGAVAWMLHGPAVGVTVAAIVFGGFVFLVAFAMAHRELTATPAPPTALASASEDYAAGVAVASVEDEPPTEGDTITRLAG